MRVFTALVVLFVLVAGGVCFYAWRVEPMDLRVVTVPLPPRLAEAFAGKKLVFLADLHITADWRKKEKLLALLRDLDPDYLLLGGDLVWYEGDLVPVIDFLKRLPVRQKAFAVLGDAEYMGRIRNCALCHQPDSRELRDDLPVRFLRNETTTLAEGRVRLLGLDGEAKAEWKAVCRDNLDGRRPTLVLVHYPTAMDLIAEYGADLVLAGDTHGGQIALPDRLLELITGHQTTQFLYGHYRAGSTAMFVTRGVGESILPLRLGRPPEVVVLEAAP